MITKLFLEHPSSVNETYLQHAKFALTFAGYLMLAALAALVHAVIPAACETTASAIISKLHQKIQARH